MINTCHDNNKTHSGLHRLAYNNKVNDCENNPDFPERKLWAYCLLQGVRRAVSGDAREMGWMFRDDTQVGSYIWICEHLDLDYVALRKFSIKNRRQIREFYAMTL